jgi:hypothetical protein
VPINVQAFIAKQLSLREIDILSDYAGRGLDQ